MSGDLGCQKGSCYNLWPGPKRVGPAVPSQASTPEILTTAGGENVSPIPIETLVKEKIPIISHAMLVGNKAKFLSMLLTLKVTALARHPLAGDPLARDRTAHTSSRAGWQGKGLQGADPRLYSLLQRPGLGVRDDGGWGRGHDDRLSWGSVKQTR